MLVYVKNFFVEVDLVSICFFMYVLILFWSCWVFGVWFFFFFISCWVCWWVDGSGYVNFFGFESRFVGLKNYFNFFFWVWRIYYEVVVVVFCYDIFFIVWKYYFKFVENVIIFVCVIEFWFEMFVNWNGFDWLFFYGDVLNFYS